MDLRQSFRRPLCHALSVAFVLGFSWLVSACGDEPKAVDPPIILPDPDLGPDLGQDMRSSPDMRSDMTDMPVDMGDPDDRDGDGLPNDQDNCPDLANQDQADRDRDGVGDVCDVYPTFYDPTNPQTYMVIPEDLAQPNDSPEEGRQGWTLPFMASGAIEAINSGEGDVDFHSFYVPEPMVVMVSIDTVNPALYPASLIVGYQVPNAGVLRVSVAPGQGQPAVREFFAPVPGFYSVAVSDIRNLINSQPDVGSPSLTYTLRVSAPPLPAATPLSVPSAPVPRDFTNGVVVYEVDARNVRAMSVQSTPAALGMDALYQPTLSIYDPDDKKTLAYSQLEQNNATTSAATLRTLVGRQRQKLYVIEDFVQANGAPKIVLSVDVPTLNQEDETVEAPQDARTANLIWLDEGTKISGAIGEPRQMATVADQDLYLFSMRKGDSFKVLISPTIGGSLVPELEIGHAYAQGDQGAFFSLVSVDPDETIPDNERTLEYVVTADQEGDFALRVRHQPNQGADVIQGGGAFGYTVELKDWAPAPEVVATLPGQSAQIFADGAIGLTSFEAMQGALINVRVDAGALFSETRVISTKTWEVLQSTYSSSFSFQAPETGTFWIETRDFLGRGTGMTPMVVSLSTPMIQELGALPAKASGALANPGQEDFYRFSAKAGDKLEVSILAEAFLPSLEFYDAVTFQRFDSGSRTTELVFDADMEVVVKVTTFSEDREPGYTYTLGVQPVGDAPIGALPATKVGALDDAPFGDWYKLSAEANKLYNVKISTTQAYAPAVRIFDGQDLSLLSSSSNGELRFSSPVAQDFYVSVYENNRRGDPTYDYTLSVTEVAPAPLMPGMALTAQLSSGAESVFYRLSSAEAGAIDVSAAATGGWPLKLEVLNPTTLRDVGGRTVAGTYRYATSDFKEVFVAISSADTALMGPLSFSVKGQILGASAGLAEVEPNALAMPQALPALPQVVSGALAAPDLEDVYAFDALAGERVWALVASRMGTGLYDLNATVDLVDADGKVVATDTYSGEGFFPTIFGAVVPKDGRYSARVYLKTSDMGDTGSYSLYLFADPAPGAVIAEAEPNDDLMSAQDLGVLTNLVRLSSTTGMSDAADVFKFTLERSARVGAASSDGLGHTLRLLDGAGVQLGASGPGFDMAMTPLLSERTLQPGTYYLEVGAGMADGLASVILVVTPN